ncbi:M15 family metallopeptidase [Antarcticibacterium arcticum]|uniref:D-alanyl-D-alanine dipeptidase n=1 Tax=Antarcticibacterium arcticum TaxID=2585771 RepID=A0A5B8YJ56_9FLAO|nr:M15 family metallopeptidase [Antarcticibacterium arcticum]QED37980.1 M15 family metallopeptidase [Antarcticibacterium arcticum]
MKAVFQILTLLFLYNVSAQESTLPPNFVYVQDVIPDVVLEMRYAGENNFLGMSVDGYKSPVAILSRPAAMALAKVQRELKEKGYCLKIFDAYRPQRAVNHFISWARKPEDTLKKAQFYPGLDKKDLFSLGYISTRSGHSRGSTIDLSIVDYNSGEEIDMGGAYDFFGERSHHNYTNITPAQKMNRSILKNAMMKYGFQPYSQEWWHYTYQPEPFPNTYFDFLVK